LKVLIQGDTHGDTGSVERAFARARREGVKLVIIAGDFGYGWRVCGGECRFTKRVSALAAEYDVDCWWIDGNHEHFDLLTEVGAYGATVPTEVAPRVWYVPRGTVLPVGDSRVLFIGGAHSVDKAYRSPHVSWWPQEEITFAEANRALDAEDVDVVIAHDTCHTDFHTILGKGLEDSDARHMVYKNDQDFPGSIPNRTTLEAIWNHHRPPLWVHGHYHFSYEQTVRGTLFVGLDCNNESGAIRIFDL
jgi:Calcineurin-like phosphoesterase